jgi:ferric-dicitrate binding protein FerR (iron transport regulator)
MRGQSFACLSVALLLVCAVQAAQPVGAITSSEPFLLRGARVAVAGVPSWPVAPGDDIATATSPAVISFRDGSRVTLGRNSKAKIESDGGPLLLRLLEGTGAYVFASGSALQLFVGNKRAGLGTTRGTLSLAASQAAPNALRGSGQDSSLAAVRRPPPTLPPISQCRN